VLPPAKRGVAGKKSGVQSTHGEAVRPPIARGRECAGGTATDGTRGPIEFRVAQIRKAVPDLELGERALGGIDEEKARKKGIEVKAGNLRRSPIDDDRAGAVSAKRKKL
jgi:hypothetical protein